MTLALGTSNTAQVTLRLKWTFMKEIQTSINQFQYKMILLNAAGG